MVCGSFTVLPAVYNTGLVQSLYRYSLNAPPILHKLYIPALFYITLYI